MIMAHMMRTGTAIRVGKYRSHDAVASCEDFDARGGRFQPHPFGAGRFCLSDVVENPRRSYGYACGFLLAERQNRAGHMGHNHRSLV